MYFATAGPEKRKLAASVLLLHACVVLFAGCRTTAPSRSAETMLPEVLPASTSSPDSPDRKSPIQRVSFTGASTESKPSEKFGEGARAGQLLTHSEMEVSKPAAAIPLSFEEAIATSLERDPALVTMRANEPVAQAAVRVAETYPFNPTVQVQVLPYAQDKAGNTLGVNHYVWLNQTLELAHQRRHREAGADALLNQVRWNIVQAELTSAAQTQRLYFTALYQRELLDLVKQTTDLNEQLNGIVERRFKAGLGTAVEQTTARIAARQSRRQQELAEVNFQTALLTLQRQLNLQANEPFALVGHLDEFSWLPLGDVETTNQTEGARSSISQECVTTLAFNRPDVLAAHAGVDVARANADLARANQIQNPGVGPFYERDESGTVFAGFRVQMNLPVWDTGRPLTGQREAEKRLQLTTFNQLRLRARSEAQTAIERYERACRMLAREGSNPADSISAELEKMRQQFESGQANILNVYAAQSGLLQEKRTYLDLLNEAAQAAADVTLMAGLPPSRLVTKRPAVQSIEQIPAPQELPTP